MENLVLEEKVLTPQEYLRKYFNVEQEISSEAGALRDWLDENGYGDAWDRPLSEIDEVLESGKSVVLVQDGNEVRWYETY